MTVYEIKTEPDKTYFLRLWKSGLFACGFKFVCKSGRWATHEARYDASDLRNFPDKFPVVCVLDVDELRKPIMRAVVDAKYANNT